MGEQKRKSGTAPGKPRSKPAPTAGVAPAKAVFEFWDDLFETNAPAAETIARLVRDILTGADNAVTMAHERIAGLPSVDAARISAAVDQLKVEMTLAVGPGVGKVEVKGSRLLPQE